jgi:hypothetical protein
MSVMSEYDYSYDVDEVFQDNYDEDNDDLLRINGHPVEELDNIKDYKRGIMLAEKKVDDHVACLGCTVFH